MASVTGHKKAKHGKLHEIRVKRAGNGFVVHQSHDAPEDGSPMAPGVEPQVFQKNKAGAMHKHLRELTGQMHPPEAGTADMQGYSPEQEQS